MYTRASFTGPSGHGTPIHRRSGACRSSSGLALVDLKTPSTSEICMPCLARTLELVDALDTNGSHGSGSVTLGPREERRGAVHCQGVVRHMDRQMLGGTDHYAETGTGAEHPDMLDNSGNLASPLLGQRRMAETEWIQRQVLRIRRPALGEDHPDALVQPICH